MVSYFIGFEKWESRVEPQWEELCEGHIKYGWKESLLWQRTKAEIHWSL